MEKGKKGRLGKRSAIGRVKTKNFEVLKIISIFFSLSKGEQKNYWNIIHMELFQAFYTKTLNLFKGGKFPNKNNVIQR